MCERDSCGVEGREWAVKQRKEVFWSVWARGLCGEEEVRRKQ